MSARTNKSIDGATVVRRSIDAIVALIALIPTSLLLGVAALGIKLTSGGPILYRTRRVGKDRRRWEADDRPSAPQQSDRRHSGYGGREFTMYKLRTMHVRTGAPGSPITAADDVRVFPFGAWLRATKIDELPQLFNILKGEMALVGPRPEAPEIVREHYTPADLRTLQVAPGLTSPGSLYYYTHGERLLRGDGVLQLYVDRLLPVKLGIDRIYVERACLHYDLRVICRTVAIVAARLIGVERFPDPPELEEISCHALR